MAERVLALVEKIQEDVAVSGEKLQRLTDYAPKYPLAEGMRRTARAWRDEGSLG